MPPLVGLKVVNLAEIEKRKNVGHENTCVRRAELSSSAATQGGGKSDDVPPEGVEGDDIFPEGVEGSSHVVSEPDASSLAAIVFPAGHATHDFDDTNSLAAQSTAEHVANVKVPSEHDDTPETKYPESQVG